MPDDRTPESLAGKTLRWTFSDGPSAGKTYEHRIGADGSIEFRGVEGGTPGKSSRAVKGGTTLIADQVFAISYLGDAGFTLTVILDFRSKRMVGFASNEKDWFQQQGTFDVVA